MDVRSMVESALGLFNPNWLSRYKSCGKVFVGISCSNCGARKAIPITCNVRLCPDCVERRGKRLFKRYLPVVLSIKKKHSDAVLSLLTLTIRNIYNLLIGFKKLQKALHKFFRRSYVRNRVYGGIYVYEVTIDKFGWYHIHVHALILHKLFGVPSNYEVRYLTIPKRLETTKGITSKEDLLKPRKDLGQIILSAIWEEITGDPVLDIRKIRSPKKGLRYVLKYLSKIPKLSSVDQYVEYLRTFENKPILVPFGVFRVKLEVCKLVCPYCGCSSFIFVTIIYGQDEAELFEREKGPPDGG